MLPPSSLAVCRLNSSVVLDNKAAGNTVPTHHDNVCWLNSQVFTQLHDALCSNDVFIWICSEQVMRACERPRMLREPRDAFGKSFINQEDGASQRD